MDIERILAATEDIITPEAGCRQVASAFPRAEYRTLAGIGHVPQVEAPDLVNDLIVAFVPR